MFDRDSLAVNDTGGLFFLAAAAVAGMPPLAGFFGKLLLLQAVPPGQAAWLWGMVLAGRRRITPSRALAL